MKAVNALKKSIFALVVVTVVSLICSVVCLSQNYKVYADAASESIIEAAEEGDATEVTPYALAASLSLSINGGDGKVWATVKNDYTVFPGTIGVIVQLYSSDYYAESYKEMTLVSANATVDLDMGKTISVEVSTGGVEKFWLARMRYQIDKSSWNSRQTVACRISADGEFLGYI